MPARPRLRVKGRQISNWWANLETLWAGIDDSLYGFRVYPIDALIAVMRRQRWMRRFDFDVEAVVRLCWRGVRPINLPAPVRYFRPEEGGVSHFNYWRDNAAADLDAFSAVLGLHFAPTHAGRAALGLERGSAAGAGSLKPPHRSRTAGCMDCDAAGCRSGRHLYNARNSKPNRKPSLCPTKRRSCNSRRP